MAGTPTRLSAAVLLSLLATGCVPATVIRSVKVPDAKVAGKRIIVRSDLVNPEAGAGFGPAFAQAFNARLGEILKGCGADLAVIERVGDEGDWKAFLAAASAFKPDTVMSLEKKKGIVGAVGLSYATLGVTAYDVAGVPDLAKHFGGSETLRPIWKAELGFSRGGAAIPIEQRGRALAEEMTNQLKSDGFFPGCQKVGRSAQPFQSERTATRRRFGGVLRMNFDFGGTKLQEVVWEDGSEATLRAAQLITFAGGVFYRLAPTWTLEATYGYKFDKVNGSNGTIEFTRKPLDVIASYTRVYGLTQHHLGAGATVHLGPKFNCDATGLCGYKVEYDTAVGGILQYAFVLGDELSGCELGLRYTFIKYGGAGLTKLNGGGIGFFWGFRL